MLLNLFYKNSLLKVNMNQYWVMVKYKDEPGAGFGRMYVNADNPFQAIQMAKSMYGRLLMSESANPV
jgi:hypothetical protein